MFSNSYVRVLENPRALPRAWIVHSARQVGPGESLSLLATHKVDPKRTALLEHAPPALAPAPTGQLDSAEIVSYQPDAIRLVARTAAPGMVRAQ